MTVARSDRHLVVVASLSTTSRRYKQLYRFLDASTLPLTQLLCGTSYGSISKPRDGTLAAVLDAIGAATSRPGSEAVDVILVMHGLKGAIKFEDGKRTNDQIRDGFVQLPNRHKLRMAYNLCCFGASHAPALHVGGFDAVIGSVGVNANGAFELPVILGAWTNGRDLATAVEAGNDPENRELSDAFASLLFRNVDSTKVLTGERTASLRINSTPRA